MTDPRTRILVGDVFNKLAEIPDESVNCVVTSPPYWGLRDYGVEGQIGMEPTLGEHIDVIVKVCREIRRVLRKDGTLWLNYGDCYATAPNGRSAADTKAAGNDDRTFRDKPFSTVGPIQVRSNAGEGQHFDRRGGVLKPKDLCMIPNRLAIALQDDGWWVRSEIIWHKPNPMPESVTDRPATSHEKVWLLTKSARYWYDSQAVRVPQQESTIARLAQNVEGQAGSTRANGGRKTNGPMKAVGACWTNEPQYQNKTKPDKQRGHGRRHAGFNDRWDHMERTEQIAGGANLRNVWTIATAPFSQAHFATFPPKLIEPCILAGCPKDGTVLDPFGGSGTTGLVANRLGRNAILIELNSEYADMARSRIRADLSRVDTDLTEDNAVGLPLFAEPAS